ncbi:MAG TPA: molybdopterin cofactor-binding domain-containing protein [Nitrososphaerales archaeon]|nr:molybdopterin cofactor-binding domain-containing protein [Nitrososphaerales archaeon]
MDPLEVRMKNLIGSDEFPYANPAGLVYDSGKYGATVAKAIELSGYNKFEKDAKSSGTKRRGIGLGFFLEIGGVGNLDTLPTKGRKYVPKETAKIALHNDGSFTVYSGVAPTGQGLETTLAKIVADEFQVEPSRVSVVHGDTNSCPYSADGTIASRSANLAGNAVLLASRELKQRLSDFAASAFGVGSRNNHPEYAEDAFRTDSGTLSLERLANDFYAKNPGAVLEQVSSYEPAIKSGTSAFGVHVALVEVDGETGFVSLKKIVMVHDCGNILNPVVVEGMAHGGIAQGISAALLEQVVYGEQGEILGSSLGDYLIPTSLDMPPISTGHTVTPSPTNPLGVKGGGEGGIIGVPAAIASAIDDALGLGQEFHNDRISRMPFDPQSLLRFAPQVASK